MEPADGTNRVSIVISIPGVAEFRRDDVLLTLTVGTRETMKVA